jgi:hypothetical protein
MQLKNTLDVSKPMRTIISTGGSFVEVSDDLILPRSLAEGGRPPQHESTDSPLGERAWKEVSGFRDLRKAIMWSYRRIQPDIFRRMELDCLGHASVIIGEK